jgi:hypothetical protein
VAITEVLLKDRFSQYKKYNKLTVNKQKVDIKKKKKKK